MPWTFSHPAAVIPIARLTNNKIPAIGLVIGSCSPDFGYYLSLWNIATASHSFIGSLKIALPICLFLIGIIILLRDGCLMILPKSLSRVVGRFIPKRVMPTLAQLLWMIFAVIIGIYSHILWDSFTHNPKYFRDWWPFIANTVSLSGYSIPLYKVFQHSSSVLGIILMLYWFIRSKKRHDHSTHKTMSLSWQTVYCLVLLVCSSLLSMALYAYRFEIRSDEIHHFLFINAVQGGMIAFVLLLLSIIVLQIRVLLRR